MNRVARLGFKSHAKRRKGRGEPVISKKEYLKWVNDTVANVAAPPEGRDLLCAAAVAFGVPLSEQSPSPKKKKKPKPLPPVRQLNRTTTARTSPTQTTKASAKAAVPVDLREFVESAGFASKCRLEFANTGPEADGKLAAKDLFQSVQGLVRAHSRAGGEAVDVTWARASKYVAVFDTGGEGTLDVVEFTEWARLALLMAALDEQRKQQKPVPLYDDGSDHADGSDMAAFDLDLDGMLLDQWLTEVENDAEVIDRALATAGGGLPEELREKLISADFVDACMGAFSQIDTDGNGVLTADELYPVFTEMCVTVLLLLAATTPHSPTSPPPGTAGTRRTRSLPSISSGSFSFGTRTRVATSTATSSSRLPGSWR